MCASQVQFAGAEEGGRSGGLRAEPRYGSLLPAKCTAKGTRAAAGPADALPVAGAVPEAVGGGGAVDG